MGKPGRLAAPETENLFVGQPTGPPLLEHTAGRHLELPLAKIFPREALMLLHASAGTAAFLFGGYGDTKPTKAKVSTASQAGGLEAPKNAIVSNQCV